MRLFSSCSFLILATTFVGCGASAPPLASPIAARQALQTALDAWKTGKPAASLLAEKPSIELVDFQWKAGKILSDFTISDETPGQGVHTLKATLTFKGDPGAKEVQYMAMGIDPIRIFRDEDFHRAMNMDNAPAPATKARR